MEELIICDKKFLKVPLIPVLQKGKKIYVGKALAKSILSMYSVEPSEYNFQQQIAIASQVGADEDYIESLQKSIRENKNNQKEGFQRKASASRIQDISKFLKEKEYALFPNSIICTLSLANEHFDVETFDEYCSYIKRSEDDVNLFSFLLEEEKGSCLYIPKSKDTILIIDGQHRLDGMKDVIETVDESYELIFTFILNFDRATIAELFYTINYTQKSVNKSLLYHLMGEFARETTEVAFLHETVKILNELEKSPFFGRVKMLGVLPEGMPSEMRKKANLSQASFIDALMPLVSSMKSTSVFQPILRKFFEKEEDQIVIIRLIIRYFQAMKDTLSDSWDNPNNSLLTKTITINALIKVFHLLLTKEVLESGGDFQKIKDLSKDDFKKSLNGVETINFSINDGIFEKGGGGAASLKIRNEILKNISGFEKYKDDLDTGFRNSDLKKVKDFL